MDKLTIARDNLKKAIQSIQDLLDRQPQESDDTGYNELRRDAKRFLGEQVDEWEEYP